MLAQAVLALQPKQSLLETMDVAAFKKQYGAPHGAVALAVRWQGIR